MMKNRIMITLLFALTALTSFAQKGEKDTSKMQKFIALRNAIMIEKLALTEKEQADFLPIYNEYAEKEHEIRRQTRKLLKQAGNSTQTDAEATKTLEALTKLEKEKLQLFETYMIKFKAVLPATKVAKMYAVEKEIQHTLMKKVKESKGRK